MPSKLKSEEQRKIEPKAAKETKPSIRMKTKKVNLLKLYAEMNKLSNDAVDKEVIKRFKIIIDTSEEDITKKNLQLILKEPKSVNISEFNESLQPYIKHYLFLFKRSKRNKKI